MPDMEMREPEAMQAPNNLKERLRGGIGRHHYEINIVPLTRGYILKIGCAHFAFMNRVDLIEKLSYYLEKPDVVQRKFDNGEFNQLWED